jgi:hypothetical protein
LIEHQWSSGPFVIARLATDMHAVVVADFARAMDTMVVTHFTGAMHAAIVADFACLMNAVIVTRFGVSAATPGG